MKKYGLTTKSVSKHERGAVISYNLYEHEFIEAEVDIGTNGPEVDISWRGCAALSEGLFLMTRMLLTKDEKTTRRDGYIQIQSISDTISAVSNIFEDAFVDLCREHEDLEKNSIREVEAFATVSRAFFVKLAYCEGSMSAFGESPVKCPYELRFCTPPSSRGNKGVRIQGQPRLVNEFAEASDEPLFNMTIELNSFDICTKKFELILNDMFRTTAHMREYFPELPFSDAMSEVLDDLKAYAPCK